MCGVCGCSDRVHPNHEHEKIEHTHDHVSRQVIDVEKSLFSQNKKYAEKNREYFRQKKIFCLNVLSSPGSGKTSLLVKTIIDLSDKYSFSVVEGDQQTSMDADRIQETGAQAIQINTGKGCHLDAHNVGHACYDLSVPESSVLFIENVGNLVCPADFDLGELSRVVVLSVTEGEDKPLKYPNIFYDADVILLNKSDLLPYLDFDIDACIKNVKHVNPTAKVITISVKTGEGLDVWYEWLLHNSDSACRPSAIKGY